MIRAIEYLLTLFVFLIPWNARMILRAGELQGGFWEYGTISIYATDILFIAVLLLAGVCAIQQRLKFPISKSFVGYWVLGIGYLSLSLFWSFDKPVALYAALKLFEGIALFLIVRKFQYREVGLPKGSPTSMLLWAFVASAVIQSVLAIAQFFAQSVFAWPWSGIAPQHPSDLGVAVVQFGDERWLRAYGSFPHPNVLGAFIAIAAIILFTKLFRNQENESRITNQESGRLKFILHTSCFFILVTGLFFTFSRAAWLAFFFGLIVYVVRAKLWKEKIFLQFAFFFIVLVTVFTVLFFPLVRTRIGGASRLEMQSNQERATGYREALQLIRRHPFFGVGIGNYTTAVAREFRPNDPAWSYQPAHNVFLLILSELGLVGFLFFLFFFWQCFCWDQRGVTPEAETLARGALASTVRCRRWQDPERLTLLLSIVILSLFDHSFWTLHSGILLFWGALAFNEGLDGTT